MKRFLVRIASIVLVLSLTTTVLTGCAEKTKAFTSMTLKYSDMVFNSEDVADGIVCDNGKFSVIWNDTYDQVVFRDNSSGAEYSAMPVKAMTPQYDEAGEEIYVSPQIKSPLVVYYEDPNTLTENTALGSTDASFIYTEKIENGLKVTYDFSNQEISVPLYYEIFDDHFEISVDPKEISDGGIYRVVGLEIAPFLCSLENDAENSYFMLPDGSGALIEPNTIDLIGRQGSMRVYGDDLTVSKYALNTYTKQIHFPVFGAKSGDDALLGIITSGAEQGYINYDVGAENKGYSAIYPFFRIRAYDLVKKPANFLGSLPQIQVYDDYISSEIITVSYYCLSGESADYNGMAQKYREYLTANEMLIESEKEDFAVSLQILGGLETKEYTFGIPNTVLTPLTTISQAEEIVKYFDENLDGNILVNLVGFGESGLDVGEVGGGFKIANKFADNKQIKSFAEYCKNSNIKTFLDFDIIAFNKSGAGFKKSTDTVKMLDGQTLYIKGFNNVTRNNTTDRYMLLSRAEIGNAAQKAINTTKNYGFVGVSLSSVSKVAYSDYNVKGTGLSLKMGSHVNQLFSNMKKQTTVLSVSANDYATAACDYAIGVPTASSQMDITSYDIPFYELVFSGCLPMGSEDINLSADMKLSVLKCIESGIAPSFMLSYSYDNSIVTSKFSALSSTSYSGLREKAVEIVNEISKIFKITEGSRIIRHEVINSKLRISYFENGVAIIVNFDDVVQKYGDTELEPKSYLVLGGVE